MAALMDKSVLESFQADLRVISAEARKRFPAVKDAAERGILQLRSVASSEGKSKPFNKAVADYDEIPHAFILGCQTKSPVLAQKSLQSLNRLVMYNACSRATIEATLDSMDGLLAVQIEQIRICQTVNAMLSSSDLVRGDTLAKTAVLCFKLHAYKDPMIANTAAAALMQLVSVLFDRVCEEDDIIEAQNKLSTDNSMIPTFPMVNHEHAPSNLSRCAMDAFLFIQDLFQIINGEKTYFLIGLPEPAPVMYCLELLYTALSIHPQIFLQRPNFSHIVKERMCPIVIRSFSPIQKRDTSIAVSLEKREKIPYSTTQRLLRIVSVLVKHFQSILVTECEIFLTMLVKFLNADWPEWQQTLAIEILRDLSVDHELVRQFCVCYDSRPHAIPIFMTIVEGVDTYLQRQLRNEADIMYLTAASARYVFFDSLDKSDPPPAPPKYAACIAVSCIIDLAKAVIATSDNIVAREKGKPECTSEVHKDVDEKIVDEMVRASSKSISASFSTVLLKCTDVRTDQRVLNEMERYTVLCGDHGLSEARDVFLRTLCQHMLLSQALPHLGSSPAASRRDDGMKTASISAKNMRASQTLLSVVRSIGNTLSDSWYIVLEALQQLYNNIHQSEARIPRRTLSYTNDGTPPSTVTELANSINDLFLESHLLTEEALGDLIPNLCAISEQSFSPRNYRQGSRLFGIPLLLLVAQSNVPRIAFVWPLVVPHLLSASQNDYTEVRLGAVETYTKLCQTLLEAEDQAAENGSVVSEDLQVEIFKGLRDAGESYMDTKAKQLEALLFLLQSFGQSLTQAWPYVFEMASGVFKKPTRNKTSLDISADDSTVEAVGSEELPDDKEVGSSNANNEMGTASSTANVDNTRVAFESLQLVVADFLGVLPIHCLHSCIESVGVFGTQKLDINISLTAVGLLWNIADYLHREREVLNKSNNSDNIDNREIDRVLEIESANLNGSGPVEDYKERFRLVSLESVKLSGSALWMTLFSQLRDLCVDRRPEVRKSGNQTLFGTMTMHGADFTSAVWHISLWAVMFPLLANVKSALQDVKDKENNISTQDPEVDGQIIVHHSRNTAVKQWDETTVISLDGVTSVIIVHHSLIRQLKEYVMAMKLLLEYIEYFASLDSREISMNAVGCLEKVIAMQSEEPYSKVSEVLRREMWMVWSRIAARQTPDLVYEDHLINPSHLGDLSNVCIREGVPPCPLLITRLAQAFRPLYDSIHPNFYRDDLLRLFFVLRRMVCIVSAPGASSDVIDKRVASSLHSAVLSLCQSLEPNEEDWPILLRELMGYTTYVFIPPLHQPNQIDNTSAESQVYLQFYYDSLKMLSTIYESVAAKDSVISESIFLEILKVLRIPMLKKYRVDAKIWREAVTALINFCSCAFPIQNKALCAKQYVDVTTVTYKEFFDLLNIYLFCDGDEELMSSPFIPPSEERLNDEAMDIQLVQLVQEFCLPYVDFLPDELTQQIIEILQKGSTLASTEVAYTEISSEPNVDDHTGSLRLKENLALACFETLLDISYVNDIRGHELAMSPSGEHGRDTAMDVLINRCDDILSRFEMDSRESHCPLPRSRMSEVCFVLQSVGCLVDSLIQKRKLNAHTTTIPNQDCIDDTVETRKHEQALFDILYPRLIDCIDTRDESVRTALKVVLKQCGKLLLCTQRGRTNVA
eukprot:CFRG7818T1